MNLANFLIDYDGVSDLSIVITDKVNGLIASIAPKISKLLGEKLEPKLLPLINKIIHSIPGKIHIPGTDMYLEGGFHSEIKVKKDTYMSFPLCLSL